MSKYSALCYKARFFPKKKKLSHIFADNLKARPEYLDSNGMDLIDAEKEEKKKKIQRAEQIHNEIAAIQNHPNFMNKSEMTEIEKTIAPLKNAFIQVIRFLRDSCCFFEA